VSKLVLKSDVVAQSLAWLRAVIRRDRRGRRVKLIERARGVELRSVGVW
jgi:hypothetical protein